MSSSQHLVLEQLALNNTIVGIIENNLALSAIYFYLQGADIAILFRCDVYLKTFDAIDSSDFYFRPQHSRFLVCLAI